MKILIAPDKFKGALNAREAAENIAKGLRDALPDAKIDILPMADGGEGTAEVICNARGGSWVKCKARDPLGREIDAHCAWIADEKLVVMEMSEASGMRRLSESERDPFSATTDGGSGMARALGFRFFSDAKELDPNVSELEKLTRIETLVAADVSPAN